MNDDVTQTEAAVCKKVLKDVHKNVIQPEWSTLFQFLRTGRQLVRNPLFEIYPLSEIASKSLWF